jgi:hypothetical protein
MYAGANMGHSSREVGFVLRSNFGGADVLHPVIRVNPEQTGNGPK